MLSDIATTDVTSIIGSAFRLSHLTERSQSSTGRIVSRVRRSQSSGNACHKTLASLPVEQEGDFNALTGSKSPLLSIYELRLEGCSKATDALTA